MRELPFIHENGVPSPRDLFYRFPPSPALPRRAFTSRPYRGCELSSSRSQPLSFQNLKTARLLVAQALDRIKLGGAGGGDCAENHSHNGGHDYRDYGGPAVDGYAVLGKEAR